MDKISEFYVMALADASVKEEFIKILAGKDIAQASDEQLLKIGELAKSSGIEIEISLNEVKEYFHPGDAELGDNELDAVAGGKGEVHEKIMYACQIGGQAGVDDDNFGPNAGQRVHAKK